MLQKDHRVSAFRLSPPAVPDIPLRVRSVGRNDVVRGWNEPPVRKWFTELTWTISGTGEALVNGEYTRLNANDIQIYWPGDTHHLRALSNRWVFCWITFDHELSRSWIESFALRPHQAAVAPCPETLFLQVLDHLRTISAEGEQRAAQFAFEIMLAASARHASPSPDPIAVTARELIQQHFTDPQFNVTDLSARTGVHRSTLFRHFIEAYSVKPSAFLLSTRLHRGLELLQDTRLSIQEVALAAGFADANYFARAIRAATGKNPRSFRSRHRASDAPD